MLVLSLFVVAFGGVLVLVLGRLGVEVVGDARVELAADAAALAAADELVLGGDPGDARVAAARAAGANGARLAGCDCDGSPVTVVVHLDAGRGTVLEARARAEIGEPVASPAGTSVRWTRSPSGGSSP